LWTNHVDIFFAGNDFQAGAIEAKS